MKLFYLILMGMVLSPVIEAQSQTEVADRKAILAVMKMQELAWSKNDLDGFMQGYWRSDSLKFFGSNGITYGYEQTLMNYKKRYPSADYSGTLSFKIHTISKINDGAYYVMGEYFLARNVGDANGTFMIIFKKIDGQWRIVADMSS